MKINKFFALIIVSIFFINCNKKCFNEAGIEIPQSFFDYPSNSKRDICKILKIAISGDSLGLIEFINIDDLNGEASYNQGVILVKIIKHLGEDQFLKTLNSSSKIVKVHVFELIEIGLMYYDFNNVQSSVNIALEFPIIYNTWRIK